MFATTAKNASHLALSEAPDVEEIDQQWRYFMDTQKEAQDKYIQRQVIKSSVQRQKH